jgi:hypothetical protein
MTEQEWEELRKKVEAWDRWRQKKLEQKNETLLDKVERETFKDVKN